VKNRMLSEGSFSPRLSGRPLSTLGTTKLSFTWIFSSRPSFSHGPSAGGHPSAVWYVHTSANAQRDVAAKPVLIANEELPLRAFGRRFCARV